MEIFASGRPFRADMAMLSRSGDHLVLAIHGQIDVSLNDYLAFFASFWQIGNAATKPGDRQARRNTQDIADFVLEFFHNLISHDFSICLHTFF
jgi:hypothetical protein